MFKFGHTFVNSICYWKVGKCEIRPSYRKITFSSKILIGGFCHFEDYKVITDILKMIILYFCT